MIASVRSKILSKTTASDTKQLWQLLRSTRNWPHVASNCSLETSGLALTATHLNAYFADISTDPYCCRDALDDNCAVLVIAICLRLFHLVLPFSSPGSVLGPALFVYYINDMPESVTSFLFMYADDSKVGRQILCEADCLALQSLHSKHSLRIWKCSLAPSA